MKALILLLLLLLCGCQKQIDKTEFYNLKIGNKEITVGYDSMEYLKALNFETDEKEKLAGYETYIPENAALSDVALEAEFQNQNKKEKPFSEAVLTRLEFYVKDFGKEIFLDDQPIDHISKACELFSGTVVDGYSPACVIQNDICEGDNVVRLYGDILNPDVDLIDRIEIIYYKEEK